MSDRYGNEVVSVRAADVEDVLSAAWGHRQPDVKASGRLREAIAHVVATTESTERYEVRCEDGRCRHGSALPTYEAASLYAWTTAHGCGSTLHWVYDLDSPEYDAAKASQDRRVRHA